MPFSLSPIALHGNDVEACISFYRRHVGLHVASDQNEMAVGWYYCLSMAEKQILLFN